MFASDGLESTAWRVFTRDAKWLVDTLSAMKNQKILVYSERQPENILACPPQFSTLPTMTRHKRWKLPPTVARLLSHIVRKCNLAAASLLYSAWFAAKKLPAAQFPTLVSADDLRLPNQTEGSPRSSQESITTLAGGSNTLLDNMSGEYCQACHKFNLLLCITLQKYTQPKIQISFCRLHCFCSSTAQSIASTSSIGWPQQN